MRRPAVGVSSHIKSVSPGFSSVFSLQSCQQFDGKTHQKLQQGECYERILYQHQLRNIWNPHLQLENITSLLLTKNKEISKMPFSNVPVKNPGRYFEKFVQIVQPLGAEAGQAQKRYKSLKLLMLDT